VTNLEAVTLLIKLYADYAHKSLSSNRSPDYNYAEAVARACMALRETIGGNYE
jgi:hypothetical protein